MDTSTKQAFAKASQTKEARGIHSALSTHKVWKDADLDMATVMKAPTHPASVDLLLSVINHQDAPGMSVAVAYCILTLGCQVTSNIDKRLLLVPYSQGTAPYPAEIEAFVQMAAPWAGLLSSPAAEHPFVGFVRSLMVKDSQNGVRFVVYVCLAYCRGIVKTAAHMTAMWDRVLRNYQTLYDTEVFQVDAPFSQNTIESLVKELNPARVHVRWFIVTVVSGWENTKVEDERGVLASAVVNALSLTGMPILSMIERVQTVLNASVEDLYYCLRGGLYDAGFIRVVETMVFYLAEDGPARTAAMEAYGIEARDPGAHNRLWRVARLLRKDSMKGLSAKGNEELLDLLIEIHDTLNPTNAIRPGYRTVIGRYAAEYKRTLVALLIKKFNKADVSDTQNTGDVLIAATKAYDAGVPVATSLAVPKPPTMQPLSTNAPTNKRVRVNASGPEQQEEKEDMEEESSDDDDDEF